MTSLLLAHAAHEAAWAWSWDPFILLALATSGWLYARGLGHIRSTGRGPRLATREAVCFIAGWLAVVAALVSPIDALSDRLFAVHMVQHELLMIVAAPLLVLGRPVLLSLWGLPETWRDYLVRLPRRTGVDRVWRRLTGPLVVWALHGVAVWTWHVPALYESALRNATVHAVEHLCFFITALLFWSALVRGRYGRLGYGMSVLYVFTTAVHTSVLGALLTVTPRVWYPVYGDAARAWGLSPLEDQQLGGLLMWVPAGAIFLVVGLALFAAWIAESDRRTAYSRTERLLALATERRDG